MSHLFLYSSYLAWSLAYSRYLQIDYRINMLIMINRHIAKAKLVNKKKKLQIMHMFLNS